MSQIPVVLLSLLFIFGMHFKYVEISEYGLNFYVIILFPLLLFLPFRRMARECMDLSLLRQRSPLIFLILIGVLGLYQYSFTAESSNMSTVFVFFSGCVVFAVTLECMKIKILSFESVFNLLLGLSVASTLILILQTQVSGEFDLVPYLQRIGLAHVHHQDLVDSLIMIRGRGLGITVLDYAVHNFIPLFFCIFAYTGRRMRYQLKYFVCGVILIAGILISRTDSVFLAVAAAVGILFIEKKFDSRAYGFIVLLAVFVGIYGFFYFVGPYLEEVSNHGENFASSSVVSRLHVWSTSISMFLDKPLTGIGLGNFSEYLNDYSPYFHIKGYYSNISAHSMIFDMLASGGLVGIGLWIGYLISMTMRARYCLKIIGEPVDKILYASLIAYIVMGFFANVHIFTIDLYIVGAIIQYRYESVFFPSRLESKIFTDNFSSHYGSPILGAGKRYI